MLQSQAVPLDELIAPLSANQVYILIEALDDQICDQMDIALSIIKGMNLAADLDSDVFDSFLENGYLISQCELSEEMVGRAGQVIDYFRQKSLRSAVKAYLFLDGKCLEHSNDRLASSYDVLEELKIPKSVEIAG